MTDVDLSRARWRKSAHSGGNGGDCVELTPAWQNSPPGGGNGGTCAAVAEPERLIAVRDSKDPGGPVLAFTPDAWRAFTAALKPHGRSSCSPATRPP